MRIKYFITTAVTLVFFAVAPLVSAACTPGSGIICNPLGDINICSLLVGILQAFLIIGAPIAVVFVIIAGTKYVLALGKPEAIKKAHDNLKWTLIGIAIFFGAIVITQVIFKTVSGFLAEGSKTSLECAI